MEKPRAGDGKTAARLLKLPMLLVLCVLLVSEGAFCFYARLFPRLETTLHNYTQFASEETRTASNAVVRLERGPLKGIRTVSYLSEKYEAILWDMDRLKAYAPKSLFVMNYCYFGNLYLDLPYACFNSDTYDTAVSRECLLDYWTLHPDARPDCIYIPYFSCEDYKERMPGAGERLAFMRSVCDCEVLTGEAGYLLKVLSWRS